MDHVCQACLFVCVCESWDGPLWGPHLQQNRGAGSWARVSCAPGSGLFLFAAPQAWQGRQGGKNEEVSALLWPACDMRGGRRAETGDRFLLRNLPRVPGAGSQPCSPFTRFPWQPRSCPGDVTALPCPKAGTVRAQPWATTWLPGLHSWFLPAEALAWKRGGNWWKAELRLLWLGAVPVPCPLGGQGGLFGSPQVPP